MKTWKALHGWQKVNRVIWVLHLLFPVWLLALMYTSAFSGTLVLIGLTALLLPAGVNWVVQKCNKGKRVLYAARGVAVCACIAFYTPMLLLMCPAQAKSLYPIKRADYIYGVYGENTQAYQRLLPEHLPAQCTDYSFRTQGSLPAQDYHPSAALMFRTDAQTMDAYAAYYDTLPCQRLENGTEQGGLQKELDWFCGQVQLRRAFDDVLDHAVLYWFDATYPQAVLLNPETGLVAILA